MLVWDFFFEWIYVWSLLNLVYRFMYFAKFGRFFSTIVYSKYIFCPLPHPFSPLDSGDRTVRPLIMVSSFSLFILFSVFVSSFARSVITNPHRLSGSGSVFLTVSEVGESEIRVPSDSVSS